MNRTAKRLLPAAALVLAAFSAPANANGTRASDQLLPGAAKLPATCGTKGALPCSVGPKSGFPDTRGLDRAMRSASDNAAFKRADSPGG